MSSITHILTQAAHRTPSADNSQPWKLEWQDNTLTVSYDTQRVGNRTFPADSHAILLSMGALSENLTQAASALGVTLDFEWSLQLSDASPAYFRAKLSLLNAATPTTINNLPLFKRHTNRFPYQDKPLAKNHVEALKNLAQHDTRILVFEEKSAIRQIAELVRQASEIRFQTQEVHEWLAKSFRFNTKADDQYGDGLDLNTIDLPVGGSLFLRSISDWRRMNWLNKLGAYKVMAMIDSQPIRNAPALIAIIGPDSFKGNLTAGQLMNRAWIALNEQDIAAHPFYVVSDQLQRQKSNSVPLQFKDKVSTLSEQTQHIFGLQHGETLHMLLRIGYPKKTPIYSKRLPLNMVCSGISVDVE